jgi:hypothetical protein
MRAVCPRCAVEHLFELPNHGVKSDSVIQFLVNKSKVSEGPLLSSISNCSELSYERAVRLSSLWQSA